MMKNRVPQRLMRHTSAPRGREDQKLFSTTGMSLVLTFLGE